MTVTASQDRSLTGRWFMGRWLIAALTLLTFSLLGLWWWQGAGGITRIQGELRALSTEQRAIAQQRSATVTELAGLDAVEVLAEDRLAALQAGNSPLAEQQWQAIQQLALLRNQPGTDADAITAQTAQQNQLARFLLQNTVTDLSDAAERRRVAQEDLARVRDEQSETAKRLAALEAQRRELEARMSAQREAKRALLGREDPPPNIDAELGADGGVEDGVAGDGEAVTTTPALSEGLVQPEILPETLPEILPEILTAPPLPPGLVLRNLPDDPRVFSAGQEPVMIFPVVSDAPPQWFNASSGLSLRAIAFEPVVAPFDGVVAFSGPYLNYGIVILLDHNGGKHSLISGPISSHVLVGEPVLLGEPIATVNPEPADPRVYVELRDEGRPIDLRPWYGALGDEDSPEVLPGNLPVGTQIAEPPATTETSELN